MPMDPYRSPGSMTMQEYIAQELRNAILRGEFGAGESLIQEALSEKWNVSRAPVREAMRILQAEGVLTYRPRRGYTVRMLAIDELDEIFDLREILETRMLRAIESVGDDVLDAMTEASEQFARSAHTHDLIAMTYANRSVHFRLFECAGQPRTLTIVRGLWESTDPYRSAYYQDAQITQVLRVHQRVIDLARLGGTDALAGAYTQYRRSTRAQLRNVVAGSTET